MSVTNIVGERHLMTKRMAVNVAFAHEYEPPPILIAAVNKRGQTLATRAMRVADWHAEYVTGRKLPKLTMSVELSKLLAGG